MAADNGSRTFSTAAALRLLEALRLRIKDLDFERQQVVVKDGKGAKNRMAMLLERVIPALSLHLGKVRVLYARDLERR